jgi:hypothetical protein
VFEKNIKYKFNAVLDNGYTPMYTGHVLEEDDTFLKIKTIKNEEIILRKDTILKVVVCENERN